MPKDHTIESFVADLSAYARLQIAKRDAKIERLRAALTEAKKEIEWWAHEHGCCRGHQDHVMIQIDAALDEQSPPGEVR